MTKKQLILLFVVGLTTGLLSFYYSQKFPVKTDILTSLSRTYFDDGYSSAYKEYERRLSHQVLILIEKDGADADALVLEALDLREKLNESGLFFEFKNLSDLYVELNRYYYSRRDVLLSNKQVELVQNGEIATLKKKALKAMYSPFFASSFKLKDDPLLLSDEFLQSHEPPIELIPYRGFQLVPGDKARILLKGEIKVGLGGKALKFINKLNQNEDQLKIFTSSLAFYSAFAKEQAVSESSLFSFLSVISLLALFWFYFRTLRHLVVALTTILSCCLVGLYISSFVFGSLHLMTVLLGISILGIMADYFIHFFIKESSLDISTGSEAYKQISKPLLWSMLTSICGFSLFVFAPLPILKEFSLFTSTTLLASYFCVKYLLPFFYSSQQRKVKPHSIIVNEYIFHKLKRYKRSLSFILIFIVGGVFTLNNKNIISNDIREFAAPSPLLKKYEDHIREVLELDFGYELFIVKGNSPEELLLNEQTLKSTLNLEASEAEYFSDWVPSLYKQQNSQKAYALLPKYSLLNSPFITPRDFLKTFSEVEFARLWLGQISSSYFSIVPLYKKINKSIIEESRSGSWTYMNKVGFINKDLKRFLDLLFIGTLIFLVLFTILLSFKIGRLSALKIVLPPLLGITLSLTFNLLIKGQLDLFNFLGCILILALGIDYAFFYYFNRKTQRSTAKGIEISTLTTIASFGILALSSTQAVNSFGMTVLLGILVTWVLIPMSAYTKVYNEI